jgi:hypothetical protein
MDKYRNVRGGGSRNPFEDFNHLRVCTNQRSWGWGIGESRPPFSIRSECGLHYCPDFSDIERLRDHFDGAGLNCGHCRLDVSVPGEDNTYRLRQPFSDNLKEFDPRHTRQADVDKQQIRREFPH